MLALNNYVKTNVSNMSFNNLKLCQTSMDVSMISLALEKGIYSNSFKGA
jgi:hypothetical protein